MPIVDHGYGVHIEYKIPTEIKNKIPPFFYTALAGELFSVFGWERAKVMFYPEEAMDYVDLDSGSAGWVAAFKMTCRKLALFWLVEYYETLPWYDSDVFDGIIEQEVWRHFMNADNDGPNDYYRHLLSKEALADEDMIAAKESECSDEI